MIIPFSFTRFIPRHSLVAGYHVFMLAMRVSVHLSVRTSFSFDNLIIIIITDFILILHMHLYLENLACDCLWANSVNLSQSYVFLATSFFTIWCIMMKLKITEVTKVWYKHRNLFSGVICPCPGVIYMYKIMTRSM